MIWQIPIFWGDHKKLYLLPFTSLASGERAMMSALAPSTTTRSNFKPLNFCTVWFLDFDETSVSLDPMLINFCSPQGYLAAGLLSIDLSKLPTQLVTLKLVQDTNRSSCLFTTALECLGINPRATGSLNHTNVVSDSNHYQK